MAGVLEALITSAANSADLLGSLPRVAKLVPLEHELVIVPITTSLREALGDEASGYLGFDQLTGPVAALARAASMSAWVMYCHLEFHGGNGFQAAAIWLHGSITLGPLFTANHPSEQLAPEYQLVTERSEMAINVALRHLGITATDSSDEFDRIGLGRHRWTDDWANAT